MAKQLEFYKAEVNKLRVFLKAEGLKNSQSRYFEMNTKKSLKVNLNGKIILEYPTIFVVLNHSADGFDLVPSDGKCSLILEFRFSLHLICRRNRRERAEELQKDSPRRGIQ
jgi:hypothetical protein